MGVRSSQPRSPNLNKTDGHLLEYYRNTFVEGGGGTNPPPESGIQATGGVISDYTSGSSVYRAHVFTNSGTFTVSALGTFPAQVEYLVIAGGGGGGGDGGVGGATPAGRGGGGGGAGGLRSTVDTTGGGGSLETALTVSAGPTSYTVTVGGGGNGGSGPPGITNEGLQGGDSSISGPDITTVTSTGGGGGLGHPNASPFASSNGGSGGGGAFPPGTSGGTGTANQGYAGGDSSASGNNWSIYDTSRDPYNVADAQIKASSNSEEVTNTFADFLSNGFKIRSGTAGLNTNSQTFIYAAFAEHPFKTARAR